MNTKVYVYMYNYPASPTRSTINALYMEVVTVSCSGQWENWARGEAETVTYATVWAITATVHASCPLAQGMAEHGGGVGRPL